MKKIQTKYDAIIVGAGHAGIEAALACARMGLDTLVITSNLERIGTAPCNPSIGGPAKGHLTREIDALGGEQALATDATLIHLRMLNTGKGPAVQALRAQIDKRRYEIYMRKALESNPRITLLEGMVSEIAVEGKRLKGVKTSNGDYYEAHGAIITTGTFLNGMIFIGEKRIPAGRRDEPPSTGLSESLQSVGIDMLRLKTGTVPRVRYSSIDFENLELQMHDSSIQGFSFITEHQNNLPKTDCHITRTNSDTRRVIMENLHRSALFSGAITGIGPRYCPSIEDKYHKFPDKISHPVFLEREGVDVDEVYLQGLSTSLPEDVQIQYVRTIPGLEDAEMILPGYAIEYDYAPPTQIMPTFETKRIENLFLAGQICGTSGYEEAASQGLMAGINLTLKLNNQKPLILGRSQAYIGILADDITTKGTNEPYRMFTSRAEFRLLLRHDNADFRLTRIGHEHGLVTDDRWNKYLEREQKRDELLEILDSRKYFPADVGLSCGADFQLPEEDRKCCGADFQSAKTQKKEEPSRKFSLHELLRRPELRIEKLFEMGILDGDYSRDLKETVEVEIKYEGYLKRQREQVEKMSRWETFPINPDFDYDSVKGLSIEACQKFKRVRPLTIGQAGRIEGVRPADVWLLIVHLSRK